MNEWTVLGACLVGLALVAYVLQKIEPLRGMKLGLYLTSVVACGALGTIAFDSLDYQPVLGTILGVAMVALGPTLAGALKRESKKAVGKAFDRFSPEKDPGYSGDDDAA